MILWANNVKNNSTTPDETKTTTATTSEETTYDTSYTYGTYGTSMTTNDVSTTTSYDESIFNKDIRFCNKYVIQKRYFRMPVDTLFNDP